MHIRDSLQRLFLAVCCRVSAKKYYVSAKCGIGVQIVRCLGGLFYHNHRSQRCPCAYSPKLNIISDDLYMTYSTGGVRIHMEGSIPNTAINMLNDESCFIRRDSSHPMIHNPVMMFQILL